MQAFFTRAIQVADVIDEVIAQIGPADVRISSFSISDEFLRRAWLLKEERKLLSLHLILDFKATNKTMALWPFMSSVASRVSLADNHSKVILLSSPSTGICVSVITSQNTTRGNRAESAIITTDPGAYADLSAAFNDLLANHSMPLGDLFNNDFLP